MEKYRLSPYLKFNGNCKDAFTFYSEVFGSPSEIMLYGDVETPTPAEFKHLVLNASIKLSSNELTGADHVPGFGEDYLAGNNFAMSLSLDSLGEAERTFKALANGGVVIAPLTQQFAAHVGILRDQYGITWVVMCQLT